MKTAENRFHDTTLDWDVFLSSIVLHHTLG